MFPWLESLRNRAAQGTITLTAEEYFDFFASLFDGYQVTSFSVTSRIDPAYWRSPAMRLYLRRQKENIQRNPSGRYRRIFLVDDLQLAFQYHDLFSVITEHKDAGIDVRVLRIKSNERSTVWRPQDFGVVLLNNGERIGMYLDVDEHGKIHGGYVFTDDYHLSLLENAYERLWVLAKPVKDEAQLFRLRRYDISEIYGNRCVGCMLDVEERLRRGDWETEPTGRRIWYEINAREGSFLERILRKYSPKRVLEIGVGTGRVLNIVRKVLPDAEIVGYEQNAEICELAMRRTGAKVLNVFVGRDGDIFHPIPSEHVGYFDMVIAAANLVGWQDNELEFIREALRALRPNGKFVFTVYRRGVELERMRMYRAEGDIVRLVETETGPQVQIVADYFHGEARLSKSYTREQIEEILAPLGLPFDVKEVSRYHWGVVVHNGPLRSA